MLGPILPLISHHWQLQDQQSGQLRLARFSGSFTGGLTVQKRLRRGAALGLAAGFAGFLGFALALPATFTLLMADKPSARQAASALCMSGLGAAFLPAR